ncbi:NAD(P)-binding domain-containing protein [Sedimentitalea sp.]|uniref:NAD(P)-binding domain-containing protein n=1 Tax=Sedimentitalea sp. TaxID=2048915 RepID=UPI0032998C68
MRHIDTLVIGAGQAGLAMSHCLSERSVEHVVLERGDVANSWARERWDSLRLLTPNWQSRLPGYCYTGDDPQGFMSMAQVVSYLRGYSNQSPMPIECRTKVLAVSADGQGYRVATSRVDWACRNVVMANGACAIPSIPTISAALPTDLTQISALAYREPGQLPKGGVLVVGASASGVQIASELAQAGHAVTLAAGHHIRMPRSYRGRDIQWWMDRSGVQDQGIGDVDDIARARALPSLQLVGDADIPLMDFNHLQSLGCTITGRLTAIRSGVALFSGGLANACALSDLKMRRLLRSFDAFAEETAVPGLSSLEPISATALPQRPDLSLDLGSGAIRTIVWATGFRPDFSWLKMPVFDRKGQLLHDEGHVADGLYVLGLPFMRKRKSALIDGVGDDAIALSDQIVRRSHQTVA